MKPRPDRPAATVPPGPRPVQRLLLTGQVVDHLRQGIVDHRWRDWLPTERILATSLHVSRSTLRRALAALQREGLLTPVHAVGNRIRHPGRRAHRSATHTVGLLAPAPLPLLSPFACLWVDHLRATLHDHGLGLTVCENSSAYSHRHPAVLLRRLTNRNACDCWIPFLSTEAMQRWFVQERVPCVLAGSPHGRLELPGVDTDYFASCRHAALVLLRLGHRRLLLLNEKSGLRGYHDTERGFRAGVTGYGADDVRLTVRNIPSRERLQPASLQRAWQRAGRPTALLVAGTGRILSVFGCLAQLGLRVPQDISLISRSAGSFFEHLVPLPAHYEVKPEEYASHLARQVLGVLRGGPATGEPSKLMPRFIRGESLAPPKA